MAHLAWWWPILCKDCTTSFKLNATSFQWGIIYYRLAQILQLCRNIYWIYATFSKVAHHVVNGATCLPLSPTLNQMTQLCIKLLHSTPKGSKPLPDAPYHLLDDMFLWHLICSFFRWFIPFSVDSFLCYILHEPQVIHWILSAPLNSNALNS